MFLGLRESTLKVSELTGTSMTTILLINKMTKDTLDSVLHVIGDKTSLINYGALAAVNFMNIDMVLKIVLTGFTIVWTVLKINDEIQKIRDRKANRQSDISKQE